MKKHYVKYIMALGHFCVDFTQGTLSAVLPFLIASHHYSYATAASLVMVTNLVGSVIQPVFGVLADRIDRPHMVTVGALLAGGGMAAVGFIPSFWGLCIAVIITGIGVAMLHPQAARMVNRMADEDNMGMSMGIFSFGGNAGFTIGPVVAAGAITVLGLKGTLTFLIPALVFALIMVLFYRSYEREAKMAPREEETAKQPADDWWGAFLKLGVLITCRSIIFSGFSTFLILYLIEEFSLSKPAGSALLSLYFGIGALSSLLGGKLADVSGLKKTLVFSCCILVAGTLVFALSDSLALAACMIVVMGLGSNIGYSAMVTLGQLYLPNHIGLASGVTLGLSVSIGGILAPVLGKLGDVHGLRIVFFILAGLAILAMLISFVVPSRGKGESAHLSGEENM